MFDWISDAIDWIGDGISSLWDNTIGSAVDTITDAIWDVMFEWLFNLIYGAVADLFEFINASTSSIFALSWVQSFIALFHSLAWMLFVCGLIVAVFDTAIAYESGQANIKNTCLNVLKGFMAASLVTVVPQRLYSFCVNLQGTFSSDLLGNFISGTTTTVADSGLTVIMALAMDVSLFSLFFIILFGYCTVKVVFSNIKRGGIMLCQIAVGKSVSFWSSERLHRRILQLVQAGHCDLSDGIFADNDTLSRTADLHSTRSACGWYLLVGNGSSEDCADVWIGYERQGQYDVCQPYGQHGS